MALVQYYCASTLDGFIADPDDGLGWLLDYEGSFEGEGLDPGAMVEGGSYDRFYDGVGALVSGSTTYEWILRHLAGGGNWPYPGKPYWVLSSRELEAPDGEDVRVRDGAVRELHDEIAASAGDGNVWIVGGGGVASQYAEAGLLDEVLVTVVPVALGEGKPLFGAALPSGPLRLLGTTAFGNGMVELRYGV